MNLSRIQRNSLKTRITFLTLLIFLASLWSLGYAVSYSLREDMQRLLGAQQYSMASLMAADINSQINNRFLALQHVAQVIQNRNLQSPAQFQALLEDLPIFQFLFNGGSFITNQEGRAVASLPTDLERVGVNYIDRDYISNTMRDGRSTISQPLMGRQIKAPIFGMGVPIRNHNNEIVGVLAGVINLTASNFMDRIERSYVSGSGSYELIDARHRIIVASSDKTRIMEKLPPPLINPSLDKFISGFEGSEIFLNPLNQEVITGVKHLNNINWYVAVSLPTAVAFAPIASMEHRVLIFTLILTLLSSALTWWVLVRQLRPLQETARKLAELSNPDQALKPLPIHSKDEIGQLISGFNRLLHELSTRQQALRENEELYRTVFRTSPDAVSITRLEDGCFLDINDGYSKMFGWERNEIIGKTSVDIGIWASQTEREAFQQTFDRQGSCEYLEARFISQSGRIVYALVSANTILINGELCLLCITQDVTAKKNASEQIEFLKTFDALTGVANLRLLMQRLSIYLEERKHLQYSGALLHIDLDDFKTLNDSFGHDKGDLWLKEFAKRVSDVSPEGSCVARIGGDKFAVLLTGLTLAAEESARAAENVARKIIAAIQQPFEINGIDHYSSCCIGIALIDLEPVDENILLKHAELSMYQAKKIGRGVVQFFNPVMQELVSSRITLETELRASLRKGDFILFYQRQIDKDNRVIGLEALIRWRHPTRGIISPGHFILIAEHSGLVIPLGRWVLETACHQLARWARDPKKSHLTISVNVSAAQFHEEDYVQQVLSILEKTGAPGYRLKLELTETLLVSEIENLITKMTILKGYGISFSLDDFGTGFSSLSYLQRLPLDQLKIDQSFIADIVTSPGDTAIAQTIVSLGKSLGLTVIAEGVETNAQRSRLLELGCTIYQGYLYGKPASIEELSDVL